MMVLLNGQPVPESAALVSAWDRGFLYGDGLFETLRVCCGQPVRWAQHMSRLQCGLELLGLTLPFGPEELCAQAAELVRLNGLQEGVLRLTVSRGPGPRGYSPRGAGPATVVCSLEPVPEPAQPNGGCRLVTSRFRVWSADPLAAIKSTNKLRHVLARAEAEAAGADAALLLNEHGQVAEADSANVFWIEAGTVCTPPLEAGALPGITRAAVLELAVRLGLTVQAKLATPETLQAAEAVFLTSSVRGIVQVSALDGCQVPSRPVVDRLQQAYQQALRHEVHAAAQPCAPRRETGLADRAGPGISAAQ